MNRDVHAVRVGLGRGWTEFRQSIRSPQDQGFYLFMAVAVLGYLFLRRDSRSRGPSLLLPVGGDAEHPRRPDRLRRGHRPGVRAGDGAGGRHPAAGQGGAARLVGYVTGQLLLHSLGLLPLLLVVLVPSFLLFDDLMHRGAAAGSRSSGCSLLGTARDACRSGSSSASLVPSTQKVGTWGMLPVLVLAGISGIFYPIQ